MKSCANFADYVKDTVWFDELGLKGWDVVKKHINSGSALAEVMIEEAQSTPPDYISKYYVLDIKKAEALSNAIEDMYEDFQEKTGLSLKAEVIYDDYNLDGIEPGLQFLVYGVRSLTMSGMKAMDAGKITSGSWISES